MTPVPQAAFPQPELPQRPGVGTILRTLADLLDQWRLVFGLPLALAVLTAIVSLIMTPYYRARASFIVDSGDNRMLAQAGGLAGLATQFGINVGATGGESPSFYADLAKSEEVLLAVASAGYQVGGQPDSVAPLWTIYRLRSPDTPRGRELVLKRLRHDVGTDVSLSTGLVALSVDAPDRALAAAVADTLLATLNRFNLERRQLRSRASRRFLESRVGEARQDLRGAEDSLRAFRERNRLYAQSEDLMLQDQRLQREVDLRQQIYVTLSTSYEQARIEEVRDTPTITTVDPPRVPYDKVRPRRRVLVLGAGFLGLVVSVGVGLLRRSLTSLGDEEMLAWAAARSAAERVPLLRTLVRRRGQRPAPRA